MATTISTGNGGDDTITGVRVDIARLEGLLTGFLTDGVRRIDQSEKDIREQRRDMNEMDNKITHNASSITNIQLDVTALENKNNSQGTRVLAVISSIVAVAGLLWNVVAK